MPQEEMGGLILVTPLVTADQTRPVLSVETTWIPGGLMQRPRALGRARELGEARGEGGLLGASSLDSSAQMLQMGLLCCAAIKVGTVPG